MFSRAFFGGRFWAPRYFGDGGDIAAAVETPSGGWSRRQQARHARGHSALQGETESQREARIKADRIRMGIIPPDPPDAIHSISSDTTSDIAGAGNMVPPRSQLPLGPLGLGAYLLPEDLAGLEALAARAAELTMEAEIAMWLRLDQQRRLHEAWLRDEDDAAVLLLAIATIH